MAFQAYEFTFDGQSCRQYDLLMYDIDGGDRNGVSFSSVGEPQLETVFCRPSALLRGVEPGGQLSFSFTFGLCPDRIEQQRFLDRFEIERIASWLTGHNSWKWLTIDQPDLKHVRYRCMITELETIAYGWQTYAFRCTVTCDSPYAYMYPRVFQYQCDGDLSTLFFNRSSMNRPYSPLLTISTLGSADVSICNEQDGGRGPAFCGLPSLAGLQITIDNQTGVITNNEGLNLYPYFNFEFLRLMRGDNKLAVHGNCELSIACEFPVNVGA